MSASSSARVIVTITDVKPNYKVALAPNSNEPLFVRKSSMRGGPTKWAELKLGDRVDLTLKVAAGRPIVADAVLITSPLSLPPSPPSTPPPLRTPSFDSEGPPPGAAVKLIGLLARLDLNNQLGVVSGPPIYTAHGYYSPARYPIVVMANGELQQINLKLVNLQPSDCFPSWCNPPPPPCGCATHTPFGPIQLCEPASDNGDSDDLALPSDWSDLQASPPIHTHFDSLLPDDWMSLFSRCMTEVHDILGGGFECHVIATHTHRKSPPWPLTSKAASREVEQLLDEHDELRIGEEYCTTVGISRHLRILVLQYDTICPAHRRSVIAHEYLHVHQLSLLREYAAGKAHDDLPMWLLEGTAACFEHLFINEYYPGLEANGLVHAVRYTHEQMSDKGLLVFDATRERYDQGDGPSMNYYVETTAVLFLCDLCNLHPDLEVLFTTFWKRVHICNGMWQTAFEELFGRDASTFYTEFNAFMTTSPKERIQSLVPSSPVLKSCCRSERRALVNRSRTISSPGIDPNTGRKWSGTNRVCANLGVCPDPRGATVRLVLLLDGFR